MKHVDNEDGSNPKEETHDPKGVRDLSKFESFPRILNDISVFNKVS